MKDMFLYNIDVKASFFDLTALKMLFSITAIILAGVVANSPGQLSDVNNSKLLQFSHRESKMNFNHFHNP